MQAGTSTAPDVCSGVRPITEDVACVGCGYNLRGLAPAGHCPECNARVDHTLHELEQRRHTMGPPLWTSDRRWLTDLTEGAAVVVVVLILMLVLAFAPAAMWAWRSRSRELLLGIGCSIWVLSWFSAWNLGSPEPGTTRTRVSWLRAWATLYLTLPFWWGLMPRYDASLVWLVPVLAAVVGGAVAGAAYYWIVRDLAWRMRSRFLPIHATLLAVLAVLVLLVNLLMPGGHHGEDSLSLILGLPTIQIGSAQLIENVIDVLRRGWPRAFDFLLLLFPLWPIVVNAWLLALLIATKRRAAGMAASV